MSDRVGVLFEILDAMGEDTRFRFTLERVGGGAPLASLDLPHAESDGQGGLSRFLRRHEIAFTAPSLRRETAPPPWRDRVRALVRVARHQPAAPLVLTRRSPWTPGTRVTARAGATRLLSAGASARVFALAKASGVSVTSLLLHGLTETVVPRIATPSAAVTWAIPVNMRGPVRGVPADGNCSSLMPVDVPRGHTPVAVHLALREALAADLHWGKWDQVNLAARLGRRVLAKKVRAYYQSAGAVRIGAFSNLGAWTGATDADVGVLAHGVPLLPDPLFATALTWNGKLGLALRAHPSLTTDDTEVAGWLDAWIASFADPFVLSERSESKDAMQQGAA
jgi:hypothetical protein